MEAGMTTITLKNVPPNVHIGIKKRAEKHHRSVNSEIVYCLERILGLAEDEVDDILAKVEIAHKGIKVSLKQSEIRAAINEGRK